MNKSVIVVGQNGHTALMVNTRAPEVGSAFDCPCKATIAVERVIEGHTTEYSSRCVTTSKDFTDNRALHNRPTA